MRIELIMAGLVSVFSAAVFCLGIARRDASLIGLSILWLSVAGCLFASNSGRPPQRSKPHE